MAFNCKNISRILFLECLNSLSWALQVLLKTMLFTLLSHIFILKVKLIKNCLSFNLSLIWTLFLIKTREKGEKYTFKKIVELRKEEWVLII